MIEVMVCRSTSCAMLTLPRCRCEGVLVVVIQRHPGMRPRSHEPYLHGIGNTEISSHDLSTPGPVIWWNHATRRPVRITARIGRAHGPRADIIRPSATDSRRPLEPGTSGIPRCGLTSLALASPPCCVWHGRFCRRGTYARFCSLASRIHPSGQRRLARVWFLC